jgi:deazaflavin-dependent oxidoreductase (nitroreductase family)
VPIPKKVARFNRVVTNSVTRPIAGHLPGFGIVLHQGRRSGKPYRTPVNMFRAPDGYVVALTYGTDTDWIKNVMTAGGCELEVGGRRVRATAPRIVHDPERKPMPPVVRQFLGLIKVTDFLFLDASDASEEQKHTD